MTQDLNTLICLFHHKDQAHAALEDILRAGIPESNVTLIGDPGSRIAASASSLDELNVPQRDLQHLLDGLRDGGVVLSVAAISDLAGKVESIFKAHQADKIDENVVNDNMSAFATPRPAAGSPLTAADDLDYQSAEIPEGDQAGLLTPGSLPDQRTVRVYRLADLPLRSSSAADTEDIDPREIGLDGRMKPIDGNL